MKFTSKDSAERSGGGGWRYTSVVTCLPSVYEVLALDKKEEQKRKRSTALVVIWIYFLTTKLSRTKINE